LQLLSESQEQSKGQCPHPDTQKEQHELMAYSRSQKKRELKKGKYIIKMSSAVQLFRLLIKEVWSSKASRI